MYKMRARGAWNVGEFGAGQTCGVTRKVRGDGSNRCDVRRRYGSGL